MLKFIIFLFCFTLSASEPKINLKFSIDTRFGLINGSFDKTKIEILDFKEGIAKIEVDLKGINSNNSMRDNHLKNEDFFDIKNFPKAYFELFNISKVSENKIKGNGNLKLKNKLKSYFFDADVQVIENWEVYKGKIAINRKDFDINYDSSINPINDIAILEFTVSIPKK